MSQIDDMKEALNRGLPKDGPKRTFHVSTHYIADILVEAHSVTVSPHGELVFYEEVGGMQFIIRSFAPGHWQSFRGVAPTREQLEAMLRERLEEMEAAAKPGRITQNGYPFILGDFNPDGPTN
jgi:hypothetical protein